MPRLHRLFLLAAVLPSFVAAAPPPTVANPSAAHAARRVSTPEDIKAIEGVVREFQEAIIAKDTRRLSALLHGTSILFTSPANPEQIKRVREKYDVNFDGIVPAGYPSFGEFISTTKDTVRENFYNVDIVQDGHLAWVTFDFDFIEAGKVYNHGVEAWQMIKGPDGKWRIFSVVWSSKGTPK